jgi:hypothetical protein
MKLSLKEQINKEFTDLEIIELFEAARIALMDADIFDALVQSLDVSDLHMTHLHEKLTIFMDRD